MVSENHCCIEKQSCFQGIYSFLKESFKMDLISIYLDYGTTIYAQI